MHFENYGNNLMRHSNKTKICYSIIILLILISIAYFVCTVNMFEITPIVCKGLFSVTPEEYAKAPEEYSGWSNNPCMMTWVNHKGNLVLVLSDKQVRQWLGLWQRLIDDAKATDGVEISNDYSKLTLTVYKETLNNATFAATNCFYGCLSRQIIYGRSDNSTDFSLEFTVIDAGTNEVTYTVKWPDDELYFNFNSSDYEYTSLYD